MAKCPREGCDGNFAILSLDPFVIRCEKCAAVLDVASDGSSDRGVLRKELADIQASLAKIAKSLDGPPK